MKIQLPSGSVTAPSGQVRQELTLVANSEILESALVRGTFLEYGASSSIDLAA
jgi:hypothetical protein